MGGTIPKQVVLNCIGKLAKYKSSPSMVPTLIHGYNSEFTGLR